MDESTNLLKEKLSLACRILYYERATTQGRGHQSYVLEGERMLIPGHLHPLGLSLGDMMNCWKRDIHALTLSSLLF